MARRHWIWDAYRALTQERRMTEAEAIGELTALWPSLPVFEIVRAEGDLSRSLGSLISQGNGGQQEQRGQQSSQQGSGNQQGSSNGQGEAQEPAIDPNDFNAMIRQRSGYAASTVTLPREAITGVKGQGEYKPEDDPFRSRYVEKYGS